MSILWQRRTDEDGHTTDRVVVDDEEITSLLARRLSVAEHEFLGLVNEKVIEAAKDCK